jgi:hypothetical protein
MQINAILYNGSGDPQILESIVRKHEKISGTLEHLKYFCLYNIQRKRRNYSSDSQIFSSAPSINCFSFARRLHAISERNALS